jgi:hypothetical protein
MGGFFDSPLFWIIVIWWLLSTFLGAKARKRRALRAMATAEEESAEQAPPPDEEVEAEGVSQQERPFYLEAEDVATEEGPPTMIPPQPGSPGRVPRPAPKPGLPLEDILRGLGIPRDVIPSPLRPEEEVIIPEELEPEPPLDIEPEPEEPEEVYPVHVTAPVEPTIRDEYRMLAGVRLARLTPMQQAIVLKEILDSPIAFRRDLH